MPTNSLDVSVSQKPAFVPEQWLSVHAQGNIHTASTYVLIASYISSIFAPRWTSPLLHRFGYNFVSTAQSAVNSDIPPETYQAPNAQRLKGISNNLSTLAMLSGSIVMATVAMSASRKPLILNTLGRLPVVGSAVRQMGEIKHPAIKKIVHYGADTAVGFSTTGFCNALALAFGIMAAKSESNDLNAKIVASIAEKYPELTAKEADEIVKKTVPHMHDREAGFRVLGTLLSASAAAFNVASLWNPVYAGFSGQCFAWGLVLPSWPVGNLPEETRYNDNINDLYIKLNEVTKSITLALGGVATIGLLALLWKKGDLSHPLYAWSAGKADNLSEITGLVVASALVGQKLYQDHSKEKTANLKDNISKMGEIMQEIVNATPAAFRKINHINPRLLEQRSTLQELSQEHQGVEGIKHQGYDSRNAHSYAGHIDKAVEEYLETRESKKQKYSAEKPTDVWQLGITNPGTGTNAFKVERTARLNGKGVNSPDDVSGGGKVRG